MTTARVFAALAVMVTLAYARPTLASRDMAKGEFYLLVLYATMGMMVMISANDMLALYLGLELQVLLGARAQPREQEPPQLLEEPPLRGGPLGRVFLTPQRITLVDHGDVRGVKTPHVPQPLRQPIHRDPLLPKP